MAHKLLGVWEHREVFQDDNKRIHYVADLDVDVDGHPHSYRLDNKRPPALDDVRSSAGYPFGSWGNVLVVDPYNSNRPYSDGDGFCVSMTSYRRHQFGAIDRRAWLNAEEIDYIVCPGRLRQLCRGVLLGCYARVTRLTDNKVVEGFIGDFSGSRIGEAAWAVAKKFDKNLNANNGDERNIYFYEIFPDTQAKLIDPVTGQPFLLQPAP